MAVGGIVVMLYIIDILYYIVIENRWEIGVRNC